MKIGLRAGHSDYCTGASGVVDEHKQMKLYYQAVKSVFEKYGHTIVDCNSNASSQNAELAEGANKCNAANCDLFISLHMNSFNGQAHGTETLVSSPSSTAYPYAVKLVNNFSKLGFQNRGVKFQRLYEMNHIKCGNIISEICFCDSIEDIKIYNQYSWEKLAHVLCNAIDSSIPFEPGKTDDPKCYVVTQYLPNAYKGYDGVDIDYVLSYFKGVKCYIRYNEKGIWIETSYITKSKAEELKSSLGSWFYSIEY